MKTKHLLFILPFLFLCLSFVYRYKYIDKSNYYHIKVFDLKADSASTLSEYIKEDIHVMIFHSISCPFNNIYEEKLSSIKKSYAKDSVHFVYVNSNAFENNIKKTDHQVLDFQKSSDCSYILDQDKTLKNLFNIQKNGTIVVFKQDNTKGIRLFYTGPLDDSPQSQETSNNYLDLALKNALLKDRNTNIDVIQTGCRITNH